MRLVASALLLVACGGGSANTTADHPQGATDGGAGQTSPQDAGPTTTTTVLMGDGGELQGTKLTTSQGPVTRDGGSSGPPPAHIDPSERDPGRRIEDIQAIIQTHRPDAQACYESALKNHPGIAGYLDVTWKLDPKGNVVETGVDDAKSQIHDDALVKCVGNVIRGIKWAPSPRGVETTTHYPFNFHHH